MDAQSSSVSVPFSNRSICKRYAKSVDFKIIKVLAIFFAFASVITSSTASANPTNSFAGARPYKVIVPSSYNSSASEPLIIALSGYNQTGAQFEKYLQLTSLAQSKGFLYIYPDGSADPHGIRFWNGTPECCDFQSPKVDDNAYLLKIISEVSARFSVDQNRIYVVGHSNGGFMANQMACKNADQIAAIVNFAGGSYTTIAACKPSVPISVLEIWGTKDETYVGNHILGKLIPGAVKIFDDWGAINQCLPKPTTLELRINLLSPAAKLDTSISQFQGCPASTAIDFWNIKGASHVPALTENFRANLIDWLLSHPKVPTN